MQFPLRTASVGSFQYKSKEKAISNAAFVVPWVNKEFFKIDRVNKDFCYFGTQFNAASASALGGVGGGRKLESTDDGSDQGHCNQFCKLLQLCEKMFET